QRKANLQKQIQTIQKEILSQESDKQDVIDRLKKSEVAISSLNSKLDQLQEQQDEAKAEIQGLRRDADEQRELLTDLRQDLSEQLYVQYTSGLSPWSALLSGEDAQKIERDLGYLSYVAKARAKAV